jgi:hypothetical protein
MKKLRGGFFFPWIYRGMFVLLGKKNYGHFCLLLALGVLIIWRGHCPNWFIFLKKYIYIINWVIVWE